MKWLWVYLATVPWATGSVCCQGSKEFPADSYELARRVVGDDGEVVSRVDDQSILTQDILKTIEEADGGIGVDQAIEGHIRFELLDRKQ